MFRDTVFKNRIEAGRRLASALSSYKGNCAALVLGIPRGGVVVAAQAAEILDLPLDVFMVRKLGAPGQQELAMGAIAEGGYCVRNRELFDSLEVTEPQWEKVVAREKRELERRIKVYRGSWNAEPVKNKIAIVVDDGLATGATMEAAVLALKEKGAQKVIAAVPVAPEDTVNRLQLVADEVVVLLVPERFDSVGSWYEEFSQTEDEEVLRLLAQHRSKC